MELDYTGHGLETNHPYLLHRNDFGDRGLPAVLGPDVPSYEGIRSLVPSRTLYDASSSTATPSGSSGTSTGGSSTGTYNNGQAGGQPTFGDGSLSGLSPQQWNDLQFAITQAFGGVGGGVSVGQVTDAITSYLQSTGRWTQTELDIVKQASNASDSHGASFREQGGDPVPFVTSWSKNIRTALNSWLQSVAPPDSTTSGATGTSTTDPTLAALLAGVTGGSSGATGNGSVDPNAGQPQYAPVTVSSGPNFVVPGALLLLALGLAYWWFRSRHTGGGHEAPHASAHE